MRGLGEIDLMQPNVIWGWRCRIGLKQRDWNVPRQMPLIGKKDHRDLCANLFLRGSKYFKPNASGIAAGDGKGRACGLFCITKAPVPKIKFQSARSQFFWI